MSSFYRTEALKTSQYFANGDGRDTYISVNNGGIARNQYPFSFKEDGRVTMRKFSPGVPSLGAKALKYKSNGTGRDSYIGNNHGGFMSPYSKYSFYNSLRQTPPPTTSVYYKTVNFAQFLKRNDQAKSQKEASLRLSIPKHSNKNLKQLA